MGCDAYANDDGVFELLVTSYEYPNKVIGHIKVCDLEPREKIQIDCIEGEER